MESYSPYQDRDLTGHRRVRQRRHRAAAWATPPLALAQIEERAAAILEAGKRPFLLGGEHLVTLGAFRAALREVPGYPHPPL